MILALASGMIGSSLPATIKVGCRTSGSMKTLVHPAPASSWCIYPTREPAISWRSKTRLIIMGSLRAVPP